MQTCPPVHSHRITPTRRLTQSPWKRDKFRRTSCALLPLLDGLKCVCLSWLLVIPGALWPFRSNIGCFTVWSHSWGALLNVKAFVLKIVLSLVLRMAIVFIKSDCSWKLEGRDIFFLWVCLSSGPAWQLAFVGTRDLQFWGQSQQSLTWQAWVSLVAASPFQHAPN